jgi:hypothetical protein
MLERDVSFTKLYAGEDHTDRAFCTGSEIWRVMADTFETIAKSQELLNQIDSALREAILRR